jgi:hypothetical protein
MFLIVVGLLVLTSGSIARSNRPHIVFILADDVVSLNMNNLYLSHSGIKRAEGKMQVGYSLPLEKQRI